MTEGDAAIRQALCEARLRKASAAAAKGVKADRQTWLLGKADHIARQAAAGRQGPLWELTRQLAGKKAARGPKPIAVQRASDGRLVSSKDEMLQCWEALFLAEFSGHASVREFAEARRAVQELLSQLTFSDPDLSEFDWLCKLVDALGACRLGRAVGPDALPVEFIRAAACTTCGSLPSSAKRLLPVELLLHGEAV